MRKTARLDKILLRLGYADEEQITRALRRQKSQGGRLGINLIQLGVIDEQQLLTALSEQYGLPIMVLEERSVPLDLVSRMPADTVSLGLVLPIAWNDQGKVLSLAIADPGDEDVLKRVKEAFGAKALRAAIARESVMGALGRRLVPPAEEEMPVGKRGIILPELFEMEAAAPTEDAAVAGEALQRILMVTAAASRKNFLPQVFQREGYDLTVLSTADELATALGGGTGSPPFDAILLGREMVEQFAQLQRDGVVPTQLPEITVFASVSDSILANPLPYEMTIRSLKSGIQALADYRCAELGVSPPYGLIANDVEALARHLRMRRIVLDGLHLGVHLLLPQPAAQGLDPTGAGEPFGAFASSLELATRIRFPWKLDALLFACHDLYARRVDPANAGSWAAETHLAAQLLALVWFRHNHVPPAAGTRDEAMLALRAALRAQGDRLASREIVESYLRLIAERGQAAVEVGDRQVMMVGEERIARALSPALARVGREALVTNDLADAQTMAQRRPPAAIVIDYDAFPTQVDKFTRVLKLDANALLFVLTDSSDPGLVLNLLDVGVDDVFGPPHDFNLVAARINRAIRSRSRDQVNERVPSGQFSATFEVFSFLDLMQMLGNGLKTVRIDLVHGPEKAVIYMQRGKLTHAACGKLAGEPAVYRVITWESKGEFTVREDKHAPSPNIGVSLESVLMEGCRLLDESRSAGTRA